MPRAAQVFCERFGVALPIVNAPMAYVAGGALAAAVAAAGGLGLIGGGYGDHPWIRAQRSIAGDAGAGGGAGVSAGDNVGDNVGVGVGLITWRLAEQPGLVARLVDDGFRTFFLSFDDPSRYAPTVLAAGGRLICQVQSVDEAERAVACGASAIVAQGHEAGGHGRSGDTVASLVPAVVAAIDPVPVLAAGGVTNGRDLAAMWASGAAGAVLGTRLYASEEAIDADAAKRHLVDAGDGDTIRTSVFDLVRGPEWPAGYDGRALRNATTDDWHDRLDVIRLDPAAARHRYAAAAAADDVTRRVIWCGDGVGGVDAIRPARDIVQSIASDAVRDVVRVVAEFPRAYRSYPLRRGVEQSGSSSGS